MPLVLNSSSITGLAAVGGLSARQTGEVLQVVNATYGTNVNSQNNTYVTSGLTATITPTSATSKILVLTFAGVQRDTGNTGANFQLWRNGSNIQQIGAAIGLTGFSNNSYLSFFNNWYDSPASTSAQTFTLYFNSSANAGYVNLVSGTSPAVMTLMEIAA